MKKLISILALFFAFLLRTYSLFSAKPPFTADQLKALSAGDDFQGVDTESVFGVRQTEFEDAAGAAAEGVPGVRGLALARNAVATHFFPLAGNEQAIGHDLLADPNRRGAILMSQLRPTPSAVWLLGQGTGTPLVTDYRWGSLPRRPVSR